jgi:hypothetical protein
VPIDPEHFSKIWEGCWIRYSRAEQICKKLDELLLLPQTHRMPNLLIAGETNNGKTALAMRFLGQHQPHFDDCFVESSIPVIAVQAPPIPDEGRFYQALLAQIYPLFRPSRHVDVLQREALRVLRSVNARMLIIDEIHHVLAGPMLKQRHFLNVLKYLGNELQIPIVGIGTQDAFNALHTDPQLANRFEPAILPRWTMGDEYLRLLASFETMLSLEKRPGLLEPTVAFKILSLSEGTIGEIAMLIRYAAVHAVEHDMERITGATLDACGYISPSKRRLAAASVP